MRNETRTKNKMHYLSVSWVLLLLLCSLMPPSLGTVLAGRAASDNNDIPTWCQGDQWTYTIDPVSFQSPNGSFEGSVQNFQQTVLGITGDAYEVGLTGQITGTIIISGLQGTLSGEITGTSYLRISDLAQENTTLHSEGTIFYIIQIPYSMDLVMNSTPPLEAFDFPVNVGEQWQISCLSTTAGSFSIAGIYEQSLNASQWIDETVQCDTKEQITVPAGTFDCYRIARLSANVWYSSDAGNIVKSSIDQSSENMTVHATLTLQSFSRGTQPITITENIEPSVTIPGSQVTISGQAYNTETHAPVQDETVTIEIPSMGLVWTSTTNSSGYYTAIITAPTMVDDTPSGRETGSGGVIIQCTTGGLTGYHVQTLVILINNAPTTPSITGPETGKPKIPYNCTIVAADPDGDQVTYFIDWGDNTSEEWPGVYDSNVPVTVGHHFLYKGTYDIKVKAKDIYGAESDWGYLQVKMPISSSYDHHPMLNIIQRFLERHPSAFPILRSLLGFETTTYDS
jgi:hypothetical protein